MRATAKETRAKRPARRHASRLYRGALAAGVLLAAGVGLWATHARSAGRNERQVDVTREALEEWVKTRRLISKERHDWELGRETLQDRIELVEGEIASLREKIRETRAGITEEDKKRADLVEENEGLKEASESLKTAVTALEARTRALLDRLPESLRSDVQPLSQKFPDDPETTKLSLGIRFQNVIGVLNHLNKRNREITLTSELRTLDDGTRAEVTTVYVGIAQAYFVNGEGTVAGFGTATPEGWAWTSAPRAAEAVARVVAILKNERVASFVKLPIEIHEAGSPRP